MARSGHRAQAAISFAFLFVEMRSLGTEHPWASSPAPGIAASQRHLVGRARPGNNRCPAQLSGMSIDVKRSKFIPLNPTPVFTEEMQNPGQGTERSTSHSWESACNRRDPSDAPHSTKRGKKIIWQITHLQGLSTFDTLAIIKNL